MIRSCGTTLSLCNFAVYLFIWSRGVALFSAWGFLLRTARMPITTPPQDPKEESSSGQDPPRTASQF